MTYGLEVFVQDVIAAIVTTPWSISNEVPSDSVTGVGRCGRSPLRRTACGTSPAPLWEMAGESEAGNDSADASSAGPSMHSSVTYVRTAARQADLASASGMRSCGRLGPAIDGTTVDRSSSMYSLKTGSGAEGSSHRPCSLA